MIKKITIIFLLSQLSLRSMENSLTQLSDKRLKKLYKATSIEIKNENFAIGLYVLTSLAMGAQACYELYNGNIKNGFFWAAGAPVPFCMMVKTCIPRKRIYAQKKVDISSEMSKRVKVDSPTYDYCSHGKMTRMETND